MKTVFFILLSCLLTFVGYTQVISSRVNIREQGFEILTPSPTAAAFAKYVTNPVSYYTGTPQIDVPLWEVQLKDFTLPIALSYHAGGIKVEEAASNVGLGWSLMAGGVITRAVKDKPDDSWPICGDFWAYPASFTTPTIADFTRCGYGLLWALSAPSNANFNGLDSYDIDLQSFNGTVGSNSYSLNLLRKFYGTAQFPDNQDLYLLSMADSEPDIYYFNFAGRTGKFVFDVNSGTPTIRTFPYQDLDIQYSTNGHTLTEFRITDEQGILYIFNVVERTENSYTANHNVPLDYGVGEANGLVYEVKNYNPGSGRKEFNSSWYLSRIETPLGEYLDFTYEDEEYWVANRGSQQTGLYFVRPTAGSLTYDPNDINNDGYYNSQIRNETNIIGKRLSKIENDEIRIDFQATHEREDLVYTERISVIGGQILNAPPYAIDGIVINNKIGGLSRIKKFVLDYDYFLSATNENINPVGNLVDNYHLNILVTDSSKYYKRLRLKSVQEFGKTNTALIPPFKFEYKYHDFTNVSWHRLPHRLSFQQDIWGLYNGAAANNTLIPTIWVYPTHYPVKDSRQFRVYRKSSHTGSEYRMPGASRLPNLNTIDIGMLTKIIYPSQGYTEYQYGSHIFDDEGEDEVGGGVRINRIIKHDGYDHTKDIKYDYNYSTSDTDISSSGKVIGKPIFAVRNTNLAGVGIANNDTELTYKSVTTRYSTPQAAVGRTNNSYVGYRRVVESILGNGKNEYTYSMPATWHEKNDTPIGTGDGVCDPNLDGHCDELYELTPVEDIIVTRTGSHLNIADYDFSQNPALPNTFPFPENPNYDWQRGHLLSQKSFKEDGSLVKENVYSYTNYFPNSGTAPAKVFGIRLSHHYPLLNNSSAPNAYVFRAAKYEIFTDVAKVLASETEIIHDQIDPPKFVTTVTDYTYNNPVSTQFSEVTSTDNRNRTLKTVNKYPTDFAGSEFGSNLLRTNHMHSQLLQQTSLVDNNPISKVETDYESKNGKVVPTAITSYPDGAGESVKVSVDYDTDPNIVEKVRVLEEDVNGNITEAGLYTAYLWGYNGKYPVAEVIGSTHASISALVNTNILQNPPSDQQLRTELNKIRTGLANTAAQVTTYTYDPLVGMTSQTDPNGQTIFYQYDDFNRLELIKDQAGNIVQQYSYNYKSSQ
ncbi:hypothetical protein QQ020_30240 [Fulvivirgaceae bacterium BMA12]|uniref:YD repeat-containing protein n=1 Tax=Agaribacillus aureus TaxID=3051825 RepID=A0ABT8LF30_9BACT|nr:hypothetical protein [Fulvivirgaceae bacterium BMA12]